MRLTLRLARRRCCQGALPGVATSPGRAGNGPANGAWVRRDRAPGRPRTDARLSASVRPALPLPRRPSTGRQVFVKRPLDRSPRWSRPCRPRGWQRAPAGGRHLYRRRTGCCSQPISRRVVIRPLWRRRLPHGWATARPPAPRTRSGTVAAGPAGTARLFRERAPFRNARRRNGGPGGSVRRGWAGTGAVGGRAPSLVLAPGCRTGCAGLPSKVAAAGVRRGRAALSP